VGRAHAQQGCHPPQSAAKGRAGRSSLGAIAIARRCSSTASKPASSNGCYTAHSCRFPSRRGAPPPARLAYHGTPVPKAHQVRTRRLVDTRQPAAPRPGRRDHRTAAKEGTDRWTAG
jgi:hypothetical protein